MSSQPQRSKPEQVERLVTRLADDVHSVIGGRAFPAKLIQTAVSVLSSDKAVSSEKWERVCVEPLICLSVSTLVVQHLHEIGCAFRMCKQPKAAFQSQQEKDLYLSREFRS